MLLTGLDAPIEQVMYLDRRVKEADGRSTPRCEGAGFDDGARHPPPHRGAHQVVDEAISTHRGRTDHVDEELAKLTPMERALYGMVTEVDITDGIVVDQQRHLFISAVLEIEDLAFQHARKKDFWSIPVTQSDLLNAIFRVLVIAVSLSRRTRDTSQTVCSTS